MSQTDLDRLKNNINTDPYKTAYNTFKALSYSQSTWTPHPVVSETYGVGQFEIRDDSRAAYYNAVMWYVTGNTSYRDESISIMMAWANMMTGFDITDHLTAGEAALEFANAGEIMRATSGGVWSPAQITTFQNMLVNLLYPPLLTPGGSIAANQLEAANHGTTQLKGLAAIGVFCDRQDIFNFAVSSYELPFSSGMTYSVQGDIDVSGFNYETQRDGPHPCGGIEGLTFTAQIAWNQGVDLYGYAGNRLMAGAELEAKVNFLYDLVRVPFTAADGSFHNSVSAVNLGPNDIMPSDLLLNHYVNVKGLKMPYSQMLANYLYPYSGGKGYSFLYRVDNSGIVPTAPLYGEPAPHDVVLFSDTEYGGTYMAHFGAGSFNTAALVAAGAGDNSASSMKVPAGWTATLYDGDNFTGSSLVVTSATVGLIHLPNIGWNDKISSMVITQGGSYTISNGTYQLVNVNSGKIADVNGASTANGATINQWPYTSANDQLWRVQALGNGQYEISNLNSNKAMEVSGASKSNGANLDQWTYVPAPNLASGGTASASSGSSGQQAAQAFDGNTGTKWLTGANGVAGWLQYHFATGTTWVVNQYQITSANDVPQRDPAAWQFQGSNDGSTWVTLDTQTAQIFSNRFVTNIYDISNPTAYAYYRLNITANNGGSGYGIQLSELGLYSSLTGGTHQRWTFAPVAGSAFGSEFNLQNVNSGQLMDVSGRSTSNSANIIQWPSNGGTNQQWTLQVP